MENTELNTQLNPEINTQIDALNDLGAKAAEMQGQDRGFMDPKPPKRARGRPKKDKSENADKNNQEQTQNAQPGAGPAPAIDPMFVMVGQQTCGVVSSTVVSVTGIPQNAMTLEERAGGEAILAALLQKYAPDALSAYGLEISALTVFGMYFWRVKMTTDQVIAEKIKMKEAHDREEAMKRNRESAHTENTSPTDLHFPQTVTQ